MVTAPISVNVAPPDATDAETFLALKEEGHFGGARVELLEGTVVFEMGQGTLHFKTVGKAFLALAGLYNTGDRYAGTQGTVKLSDESVPEPDVMMIRGDGDDPNQGIEIGRLLLVVEVSVTTLATDRGDKLPIYARAGIPEYWIVVPERRQIEVYRSPEGSEYTEMHLADDASTIAPLFDPDHSVAVRDLLLRRE